MSTAPLADTAFASRPAASSDAGFFAHHGLWAPGVRLFRALRFSAMADAHRDRLETWLANQRGGERWEDLGQGVRVLRPG